MPKSNLLEEHAGYHCLTHINRQTTDLYLASCGTQKCPPGHSFGPSNRPEYHLHFILDGKGFLTINNKTYHLKRGQMFLCPPDVDVYYCADSDTPWYYSWISFHGSKAEAYMKQAGFDETHVTRSTNVPPEQFTALIQEILHASQLTSANELKRIGYLYHLITLLITSNNGSCNTPYRQYDASGDTYVEHALQYIEINYNSTIHVSDIADYIGINRSHLCQVFKQKLHQSPQEYLIAFRMEKAKDMLSSTSTDITGIAKQVGYKDPLTFSKAFSRTIGCSPTDYRKKTL